MSDVLMTLYAVRNRDGQYFHAKGYGRCGETWVDSLSKARIYPKPGPARSQVTFFATNYPQFGVPDLVALNVTEVVVVDETSRVQKSQRRKEREEAVRATRRAEWERQEAQRKLDDAKATLARLDKAHDEAEIRRARRLLTIAERKVV